MNEPISPEEQVALWQEAEQFSVSPLGQFMDKRAKEREEQIKDLLLSIDPRDHEAINDLQREVRRFNDFFGWIKEVIEQGREAYRMMDVED